MFAILMRTGTMNPVAQWVVLAVSSVLVLGVFAGSHARRLPKRSGQIAVALALAVGLAVCASTASAAIIVDCSYYWQSGWIGWLLMGC